MLINILVMGVLDFVSSDVPSLSLHGVLCCTDRHRSIADRRILLHMAPCIE